MKRLDEFRLYYNHTIHPELCRLELKRQRLLGLFALTILLLIGICFLAVYVSIPTVTFFLMIPLGFYLTYLLYSLRQFVATFKPYVVNLILDFIDDDLNFGTLSYDSKRSITKKEFKSSKIFASKASFYKGEDYISGKVGELDFEMCELKVKEFSKVRNRLNYVFRGIFMQATLKRSIRGSIIILPRKFKQYLTRSIKDFTKNNGRIVERIQNEEFADLFMTYATRNASPHMVLNDEMQSAIVDYRKKIGKEIYVSFVNNNIYIAVTEPKDILEPYIFSSNVSFELVREFFEDIHLLISIVEDFDAND